MKNTLHACIIDDQDDGETISLLLNNEFPEFEIDFHIKCIDDALIHLQSYLPDLLFLNIRSVDEKTEKILSEFKNNLSVVIFIASSEESAIQAIKKGISYYLLKPLKKLDFVSTVNKAIENFKKKKDSDIHNPVHYKINLPTLQGFKRVNIDEIIRCEADSNYTFIHLSDKSRIMVSKTLYDFEKNLSAYNFFRIHHKHLINLEHLKEYIKGKGGQVIMADNSVLDVSIRRKNDFLHKIA